MIQGIQIDLRNLHFYGVPWTEMSRETGLAASTIKRFAMGETFRPSFLTVLALSNYAGYNLTIRRQQYSKEFV